MANSRRKFWIDAVVATAFVFLVLSAIVQISRFNIFNAVDPIGRALSDMELTDVTFSNLRADDAPPVDSNIVIINIGNLSRAQIAQQIQVISQFKPKVIGVDVFFDCPNCFDGKIDSLCCPLAYDTLSNMMLNSAIEEAGNVVLVTKLLQTDSLIAKFGDSDKYDSLRRTDLFIRGNAYEGYASLETDAEHQEDLKVCRRFNPAMQMQDGSVEYAFSVKMAMLFDSVKTKKFLARNKPSEVINYRGNVPDPYRASHPAFGNRYNYLDYDQPFDTASYLHSLITDKIVLFGFMGADMNDTSWDDKFITPLNKQFAGKTRPDMYGVVVHANIISMILGEDAIDEFALWQTFAIAAIICFLNVVLFSVIHKRIPAWFDGLSILIQLVQFLVLPLVMWYALLWFNFKLNLTMTLAAIALVGTCFELYHGVVKNGLHVLKHSRWFTKKDKEVLMP